MNKSARPAYAKVADQRRIRRQQATLGAEWVTTDRELIDERMSRADDNWQTMRNETDLKVKDKGKFFIGRKTEINRIINRTHRSVTAQDDGDRLPGTIVMGASGVGKTALVREAMERLQAKDVTCLELETENFTTPETFSAAVKSATGLTFKRLLKAAPRATGHAVAHTADAGASLLVAFTAIANGFPVKPSEIQIQAAANTYNAWLAERTPNIHDVLKTLAFLHPTGVAIFMDEAQTLATALDHADPKKSTAAAIVKALATPAGRSTAKIGNATIVFSGLGDTSDVIGDLGSFGLQKIHLQPMSRNDAKRLIRRELVDAVGTKQEPLADAVLKAWLPTLLNEYAEWTRHTAGAAQAVRTIVKAKAYNALTEPEGWATTVTLADDIRNQVYDHVREQATKYEISDDVRDTLAQALARHSQQMTAKQTLRLVLNVQRAEQQDLGLPDLDSKTQLENARSIIRACKRAGMLDQAVNDTPNINKGNYYCPVPSLLRNLTHSPTTDLDQMLSWIEQSRLSTQLPDD